MAIWDQIKGGFRRIKRETPENRAAAGSSQAALQQMRPEESTHAAPGSTSVPELKRSLTKTVIDGRKQYWLYGTPIGLSYPIQSKEDKKRMKHGDPLAVRSTSTIQPRRNPLSPFIEKIVSSVRSEDISFRETQEKINIRNKIAVLTEDHPNFNVEIFTGKKGGKNTYIAKKINGFHLYENEKLDACRRSGELDDTELSNKFNELERAVKWLNGNGFYHNDIRLDNIMYDTETKKLVLIDFELANTYPLPLSRDYGEPKLIEISKGLVIARPLSKTPTSPEIQPPPGPLRHADAQTTGTPRPTGFRNLPTTLKTAAREYLGPRRLLAMAKKKIRSSRV